jgi:hypothetical protein
MILDGRKMKFASRKRLNQQTKAEKQFSPAMPIHLSKKQMVGQKSFLTQIIEMKRNGAPGETRTHDILLRRYTVENSKCRCWCRLQRSASLISLLKWTEDGLK